MRTSDLFVWIAAVPLVLGGCDQQPPTVVTNAQRQQQQAEVQKRVHAEGLIPCALNGSDEFQTACTVDRTRTPQGLYLTIRHPDGGFHRLIVTKDGRGVQAADGANPAKITIIANDAIEVAVADVRYRLPATVGKSK